MRVSVTVDVDDEAAEAIAAYYGQPGKATARDVVAYVRAAYDVAIEDLTQPATQEES